MKTILASEAERATSPVPLLLSFHNSHEEEGKHTPSTSTSEHGSKGRGKHLLRQAILISNDAVSRILARGSLFDLHKHSESESDGMRLTKDFLMLLLGTIVIGALPLSLWLSLKGHGFHPWDIPSAPFTLQQWLFQGSLVLLITWCSRWLFACFLDLLPTIILEHVIYGVVLKLFYAFHGIPLQVPEETRRLLKHFLYLKPHLLNAVSSWAACLTAEQVIGDWTQMPSNRFIKILLAAVEGLRVLTTTVLLQKWCIQRLAVFYHTKHHERRISENNFALSTLQTIRKRIRAWHRWFASHKDSSNRHRRNDTTSLSASVQEHHHRHGKMVSSVSAEGVPMQEIVNDNNGWSPSSSSQSAKEKINGRISFTTTPASSTQAGGDLDAVAEDLFDVLRRAAAYCKNGDIQDHLKEADFYPFCDDAETAARFASILDQDSNGDLTRREVLDGVARIFDERDRLDQALTRSSDFIRKLEGALLGLMLSCGTLYWISLWDSQNVWQSLTALGSLALGLKFIVENLLSGLFLSIVFVLVEHPYDIGNYIVLDNDLGYSVLDIDLWTTTLMGTKGLVYVPNLVLADMAVGNVHRSEWQCESIRLRLQNSRTLNKILLKHFEDRLNDFVVANGRDFQPPLCVNSVSLDSDDCLSCCVFVKYKSNFADTKLMTERRNKLAFKIKETMTDLGLSLAIPNRDVLFDQIS